MRIAEAEEVPFFKDVTLVSHSAREYKEAYSTHSISQAESSDVLQKVSCEEFYPRTPCGRLFRESPPREL